MVEKIDSILNEKARCLEKWLKYQHLMIRAFDETKDQIWFEKEQVKIDNIREICFKLDEDFLNTLGMLLASYRVDSVEALPKDVIQKFIPVQRSIEHIQDVEALICDDAEAVNHIRYTLYKRHLIKDKYLHK